MDADAVSAALRGLQLQLLFVSRHPNSMTFYMSSFTNENRHARRENTAPIVANGSQGMWSDYIVASGSERIDVLDVRRCTCVQ